MIISYYVFSSAITVIMCFFGNLVLVCNCLQMHVSLFAIVADVVDSFAHVMTHFTRV